MILLVNTTFPANQPLDEFNESLSLSKTSKPVSRASSMKKYSSLSGPVKIGEAGKGATPIDLRGRSNLVITKEDDVKFLDTGVLYNDVLEVGAERDSFVNRAIYGRIMY